MDPFEAFLKIIGVILAVSLIVALIVGIIIGNFIPLGTLGAVSLYYIVIVLAHISYSDRY